MTERFGFPPSRAASRSTTWIQRARGVEPARDRDRIVVVDGLLVVVAARETHDLARAQVDRRIEVHHTGTGLATASTKLASMRIPTAPDFSGWNCVAQSGPISTAAANRRP